jgi:hypothetical protein
MVVTLPFSNDTFQRMTKDITENNFAASIEYGIDSIDNIPLRDDAYHGPTIHPSME